MFIMEYSFMKYYLAEFNQLLKLRKDIKIMNTNKYALMIIIFTSMLILNKD